MSQEAQPTTDDTSVLRQLLHDVKGLSPVSSSLTSVPAEAEE